MTTTLMLLFLKKEKSVKHTAGVLQLGLLFHKGSATLLRQSYCPAGFSDDVVVWRLRVVLYATTTDAFCSIRSTKTKLAIFFKMEEADEQR